MELFNKPKSRLKICIILLIIGFFIGQFFILAWLVSWFFVFKKDVESLDESYEYTPNADTNIEGQIDSDVLNNIDKMTNNSLDTTSIVRSMDSNISNSVFGIESAISKVIENTEVIYGQSKMKYEKGPFDYKCVPGPVGLRISAKDSYDIAVRSYSTIIESEAVGGWEFFLLKEIPVIQEAGCIEALLGKSANYTIFNMLVFRKKK
ncbi:MAG: hypothetical protein GX675_06910 [Erysipelotrichaceae bacterium]|nr:hypothetical protein [Erysipelotrichaceae bacterium]